MRHKITLPSGTEIEVEICKINYYMGLRVWLAGKIDGAQYSAPQELRPPKMGATHYINCVGRGPAIGLGASEAAKISALIAEAEAADPEIQMGRLIEQRRQLAEEIGSIVRQWHDEHVRSIERASEHGFYRQPKDRKAEEAKARAALAEFDAAHPEVKAEINRRKERDHQSFLASN